MYIATRRACLEAREAGFLVHFKSRQNLVLFKKTTLLTLHILRSTCKAIASIFHMQSRCTCIDVFEESNSCQRCDSGCRVFSTGTPILTIIGISHPIDVRKPSWSHRIVICHAVIRLSKGSLETVTRKSNY